MRMERGRKRNFESFSDNDDGENNSDDDENNSDDDDDGVNSVVDDHLIEDNAHVQLRRTGRFLAHFSQLNSCFLRLGIGPNIKQQILVQS